MSRNRRSHVKRAKVLGPIRPKRCIGVPLADCGYAVGDEVPLLILKEAGRPLWLTSYSVEVWQTVPPLPKKYRNLANALRGGYPK